MMGERKEGMKERREEQRNKEEKCFCVYKNIAVLNDSALWILEGTGNPAVNKVQYLSLVHFPA